MAGELLIVAPSAPDFAGFRQHLGERLDGTIRNVAIRTKVLGLGMSVAAASMARGILGVEPRAVVMVGTCAVFPGTDAYRPLELVVPTRAHVLDALVASGRGELPTPMQTTVDCHAMMVAGILSAGRAHGIPVASMLARVTDDVTAATLRQASGCDAESPELFAVASACAAARIPFAAVLGVTNLAGSTGAKDWAQFQREAVTHAANAVATWIHAGAQGLPH